MKTTKQTAANYYRENILKVRNRLGMTQSEFAEAVGLTLGGVQDIEYGKTKEPSFKVLRRIAELSGIDILSLDSPDGPRPINKATPSQHKAELLTAIYSRLPALNEDQLGLIVGLLDLIPKLPGLDVGALLSSSGLLASKKQKQS